MTHEETLHSLLSSQDPNSLLVAYDLLEELGCGASFNMKIVSLENDIEPYKAYTGFMWRTASIRQTYWDTATPYLSGYKSLTGIYGQMRSWIGRSAIIVSKTTEYSIV